jgi:hypothetical protein
MPEAAGSLLFALGGLLISPKRGCRPGTRISSAYKKARPPCDFRTSDEQLLKH